MSRWPLHKAYFWQEAPLFRPLLPLIAGIICYDLGLPGERDFTFILILLVCSGSLLLANSVVRRRTPLLERTQLLLTVLAFFSLGWCAFAASDNRNRGNWFGRHLQKGASCVVRVAEKPQQRSASTKCVVDVLYLLQESSVRPVCGKALLYVLRGDYPDSLSEGDTLLIPGEWQGVRNSGNPFAFDNVAFQGRRGIRHQQFLASDRIVRLGQADPAGAGFIKMAHSWCERQIHTYVPDQTTAGLLQAMLLGDESGFDPDLRQAYSQTGVVHIVSISGSHVAVLFLLVTGLLFWVKGRHASWVKYGFGVTLVWLYVLMAGAPPSALRSAVMFTIIASSVVMNREGQSLNTLIGAAFVLLLGEPAWLYSVGFQLSFSAVLSILFFYKPIYRLWPQATWLGRKAWQAIAASIAAEVLTAPLVMYYFHNFPLVFIVANLLSVVLVGLCALVGGMMIIAVSWMPPLARLIGYAVTQCVSVFNVSIQWLQGANPQGFQFLHINTAELLLIYLLIAGAAVCWLKRERWGIWLALPSACAVMLLLSVDAYRSLKQDRLIAYSNGRHALVERIVGRHFSLLAGESEEAFDIREAHVGWGAWKKAGVAWTNEVLQVKGRNLFLLSDTAVQSISRPFPVDVLIICRPLRRLQPGSVLRAFEPKYVVLAQRPSAFQLRRWNDSCRAYSAHLYNVADRGAFIIE